MRQLGAAVICVFVVADLGARGAEMDTEPTAQDHQLAKIAQKVVDDPSSPSAVLDILEMSRLWDVTTAGVFEDQLDRLASLSKLHPEARLRILDLEREKLGHEGKFEDAARAVEQSGIVTSWLVVGPFDNENRKGYEVEYDPESDPLEPFDTGLAFEGDERSVSWRTVSSVPLTGELDLRNVLYPSTKVCAYAGTYIEMPKAQTVAVWAAAGGSLRLWVDQTLAISDDVYRPAGLDRQAASIKLGKGTHRMLAKVCVDSGPWNLVVRITDTKGKPLTEIATLEPAKPYFGPAKAPKKGTVSHGMASFTNGLAENPDDPVSLASMARYMVFTHSDDLTQTVAGDHAKKAADATGSCEHLLLLAMATDDPDTGLNALRTCAIREPDNPQAAFLYAVAMKRNSGGADFSSHVLDLVRRFPDDLRIQLLWIQEYMDLGLQNTALAMIEDLRTKHGDVPELLRATDTLAYSAMSDQQAQTCKRELLAVRADETSVIFDLLDRAVKIGDEEQALAMLGRLFAMGGDDRGLIAHAAELHLEMGDVEGARALMEHATEVNPHHPGEWERLANFYRLLGEDDLALAAYSMVLELNPNNVQVREYMSHLFPHSKFEKEFIVSTEEIMAIDTALEAETEPEDPRDITRYDATILVSQQVDRVYNNGMSSRFNQEVIRINTEQGEKIFRYVPITYAPLREDLEILRARVHRTDGSFEDMVGRYSFPTFDPEVRIYYDVVKEVIEFPALRAGDIIDIQYKVSESTARNMFERHFGTAVLVMSPVPTTRFRYGLITPQDLEIHTDVTSGSNLTATEQSLEAAEQEKEPTVVRTWEAHDVPAIEDEPDMPPAGEISPIIKVSTFGTWEEFGRWWWGLASSQMIADKTIKDKVKELTGNVKTEEEKVSAIFDWVIRSTRYIALEFGVHGYKPYSAPQVVARGFGDCKDKATLLYVMFREAGIDASLALVRTRHAGEIGSDFPFQFQFDHVIAYVPSMDLFLDGTVDYLGIHNLPPADQDVFTLVVDEKTVTPRRTPRLSYEASRVDTDAKFLLSPDGDADVTGKVVIRGTSKAWYRSNYQTPGTQGERLEQQLATIFPGMKLDTWQFEGLDVYDADVVIEFTASIPNFALAYEGTMQFSILPSHNLFSSFASLSSREHDVMVGYPRLFVDRHTYVVPQGWQFVSGPDTTTLGKVGDPWWFSLSTNTPAPGEVSFEASLGFNEFRVDISDYAGFRGFCSHVDDIMGHRAHVEEVEP